MRMRSASNMEFQPLALGDLALLGQWLALPHVTRWWADDASPEGVAAEYRGNLEGTEPSQVFVAYRDARPIGLAQRFWLGAYPDYRDALATVVDIPDDAFSIDYLIGPTQALGRGWGAALVDAFLHMLWREAPRAGMVIVPVHADNVASWRTLERVGFLRIASGLLEPDNPRDSHDHVIYRIDRPNGDDERLGA